MAPSTYYKEYSAEDKLALKQLQEEVQAKTGSKPTMSDMISAVEPDLKTPASLQNA